MNTANRSDTYSLANGRACILLYPPDLTAEEVDGVVNWFQLLAWKLGRGAKPKPVVEKWAAIVPESPVYAPCDLGPKPAPKVIVTDDPEAALPAVTPVPVAPYPAVPAVAEPAPRARRTPPTAKGRENRIAVCRALLAGPLTSTQIGAATGIPKGTLGSLLPMPPHGFWKKSVPEDRLSPYEITDAGRKALVAAGHDVPAAVEPEPAEVKAETPEPAPVLKVIERPDATGFRVKPRPVDPGAQARDRGRCVLIAEAMAKLIVPLAAVTIAMEAGLGMDSVETLLARKPEWFEPAGSAAGGDKYRLTAAGRELARESEAA